MLKISNYKFIKVMSRNALTFGFCLFCFTLYAHGSINKSNSANDKNYKEGYYYTKSGKKVKGLLRHVYGSYSIFGPQQNFIRFKFAPGALPEKLGVEDIKAFVIESDSFAIAHKISLSSLNYYESDFVQVVEKGAINLFAHYSQSNGLISINYFINTPEVPKMVLMKEETKNNLLNLIFDHEPLYTEVKASSYWQSGLATIIEKYNRYSRKAYLAETRRLVNSF